MSKVLPPTYFLGAIVLAVLLHFLLPVHQLLAFPWRLLGLVRLLLGSTTPFAVVILFALLIDRVFISPEERMLADTFGDQFQQYRQRVRRWILTGNGPSNRPAAPSRARERASPVP